MAILHAAASFLLALIPLVLIHELGHFSIAKLNKVGVEEFGIGFPPRLVRLFERGGTEYTINWLPLGGFVRLLGEDDPDVPGAFAAQRKRVRAAVLLAGPFANFLLAGVLLVVVAYMGVPTAPDGLSAVAVGSVFEGQPAAAAGIQPGDIIIAADGQPLASIAPPEDDSQVDQRTPEQNGLVGATVGHANQPMTLTVIRGMSKVEGPLPEGAALQAFTEPWFSGAQVVASVPSSTSPEAVKTGDLVVTTPYQGHPRLILRPGEQMAITVTPEVPEGADKSQIGVGITNPVFAVKLAGLGALAYGVRAPAEMLPKMVVALAGLVRHPSLNDVSGPVGIADMSDQAAQAGADTFLAFMALLSLNLGLINLLPIPALDGGRLLFIAIEAVRGRRLEPAREQMAHVVGFVVVIGLMVVLTVYEVAQILGISFGLGAR